MNSKFIVIEGLEGAGKTSAIAEVVDVLRQQGIRDVAFTREPGGTPLAEALRTLIKDGVGDEPVTDCAELLMLYAARVQLVEGIIKPALARGAWVVGDRHDLSSQAYQGGGRGMDTRLLQTLRDAVLGEFRPDLTLYLDIPPALGLARARARGELDRIEVERWRFSSAPAPVIRRRRHEMVSLAQRPLPTNPVSLSAGARASRPAAA